jgi:hypothetical protein
MRVRPMLPLSAVRRLAYVIGAARSWLRACRRSWRPEQIEPAHPPQEGQTAATGRHLRRWRAWETTRSGPPSFCDPRFAICHSKKRSHRASLYPVNARTNQGRLARQDANDAEHFQAEFVQPDAAAHHVSLRPSSTISGRGAAGCRCPARNTMIPVRARRPFNSDDRSVCQGNVMTSEPSRPRMNSVITRHNVSPAAGSAPFSARSGQR